ncbi:MAG: tyrosine-type recombinase/integrase [Pseudomonadota bacterium]
MAKAHPKNERIERRYLQWQETAKGASVKTTDQIAAAIAAFEKSTGGKDFAAFHIEQAIKFKRDLEMPRQKIGKPLAKATIRSRLMAVKHFFKWLADQQGYKSRISHADCEYFNLNANDARVATAKRERPVPSLEQIHHVISLCPSATPVEMRDRALIAFTVLTGMRDAAIASIPIGKVDVNAQRVDQDARVVRTKNAKTLQTFFFPVGGDAEAIVRDWLTYLRQELLFADSDPLFPRTTVGMGTDGAFAVLGVERQFWSSAAPIREIFRKRFEAAGLPYFHPHSFRKTLAKLAYSLKLDIEQAKAWSQNLGHEKPMTTWTSYGKIEDERTAEILNALCFDGQKEDKGAPPPEVLAWIKRQARSH